MDWQKSLLAFYLEADVSEKAIQGLADHRIVYPVRPRFDCAPSSNPPIVNGDIRVRRHSGHICETMIQTLDVSCLVIIMDGLVAPFVTIPKIVKDAQRQVIAG